MANENQVDTNFLSGIELGDSSTINLSNSDLKDFLTEPLKPGEEITEISQEEDDNLEEKEGFLDTKTLADKLFDDLQKERNQKDKPKLNPNTTKSKNKVEELDNDKNSDENSDLDTAGLDEEENEEDFEELDELDPVTTLNNMFRSLEKKGVMRPTNEEWKAENEDDLAERFEYEGQVRASEILEAIFSKYGEGNRKFIEDIVLKGADPFTYLNSAKAISDLDNIDLENEDQLKQVYLQYETEVLGTSLDKAKRNLKRIIDSGDLEDEAKDAIENLKEFKAEDLQTQLQIKAQQEQQVALIKQQTIRGTEALLTEALKTKNFEGIKITQKDASDIMHYIGTDKYTLPDGSKISEFDKDLLELRRPENLKTKVKLALLLKDKLSLDRIKTDAVSEESESLFKNLARKKVLKNRTSGKQNSLTNFI